MIRDGGPVTPENWRCYGTFATTRVEKQELAASLFPARPCFQPAEANQPVGMFFLAQSDYSHAEPYFRDSFTFWVNLRNGPEITS